MCADGPRRAASPRGARRVVARILALSLEQPLGGAHGRRLVGEALGVDLAPRRELPRGVRRVGAHVRLPVVPAVRVVAVAVAAPRLVLEHPVAPAARHAVLVVQVPERVRRRIVRGARAARPAARVVARRARGVVARRGARRARVVVARRGARRARRGVRARAVRARAAAVRAGLARRVLRSEAGRAVRLDLGHRARRARRSALERRGAPRVLKRRPVRDAVDVDRRVVRRRRADGRHDIPALQLVAALARHVVLVPQIRHSRRRDPLLFFRASQFFFRVLKTSRHRRKRKCS